MKKLILTIVAAALRLVYVPFKCLPARQKVTIISRQSDRPSVDIRLLSEYLRQEHPDLECCVLCRFIRPDLGSRISYAFHMLTQMKHIATSRVVILDGYCIAACVLNHKPQTKIIQMWHAIAAIKRFGYQTIDRAGGHSSTVADIMCMHRNYDHILCPSEATGAFFCEAFHASAERLLFMGLPRLDLLEGGSGADESAGGKANADAPEMREQIRTKYHIPPEKELVLYVPTFRKGSPVPLDELIAAVDPQRFALVIRLHPLDQPPEGSGGAPDGHVIFSRSGSTEEWIRVCDRVITDYSALSVEAALTEKPLYFYIYDIHEYERGVGLNVDPRIEMPGATAETGEALEQLLAQPYPYEQLHRFREKYITVDTRACTSRLGDFIYGIAQEIH